MSTPPKWSMNLLTTSQVAVPTLPPRGLDLLNPYSLYQLLSNYFRNAVSWSYIRGEYKKLNLKPKMAEISKQAQDAYISFCQARASADLIALKDTTADTFLEKFKTELSKRPADVVVRWELRENSLSASVKSLRWIAFQAGKQFKFAQINVAFTSDQRLQIYRGGKRIGGTDNFERVTDYLVLERQMDDLRLAPHWRILAKLDPNDKDGTTKLDETVLSE